MTQFHNPIEKAKYDMYVAIADYAMLTSGDPGLEMMAITALITVLDMYNACGIEGDALRKRVGVSVEFHQYINDMRNSGKDPREHMKEIIDKGVELS